MIRRFWFPEWPAARLGLLRVALGLYALQDLWRIRDAARELGHTDPGMWDPVGVTTLLGRPLDPAAWATVYDVTIGLCVLFTLGLGWRVIGPLFAAFLLFTWTYRVSWQMIYHVHHLAMLHVLIVAMAPAAAALSVDAWWRRRRGAAAPPATSWHYGWPVRLLCVTTAILYLLAGVAKVQKAGWGWADGHNLLDQIAYDALYKALLGRAKDAPSPLVQYAFAWPHALAPMATMALVVELGAPLALLHRRIGYAWSLLAVGMHWGIHVFMNLVFPYPIAGIAFLSFFPVERLLPIRWRGEAAADVPKGSAPAARALDS